MMEDHKYTLRLMFAMRDYSKDLEGGGKLDTEYIKQMSEMAYIFIDKCHHRKEEKILFPSIKDGDKAKIMIRRLVKEHKMGDGHLKDIRSKNKRRVVLGLKRYFTLTLSHVARENIFFRNSNARLNDEKRTKIAKGFERLDNELLGFEARPQIISRIDELCSSQKR